MTTKWILFGPRMTMEDLGFLPSFLSEEDPRPAKEQINANYLHGGGWEKQEGFEMGEGFKLKYPEDPDLVPRAMTKVRDERILFYDLDYVAIVQPDGSFEVCRVD